MYGLGTTARSRLSSCIEVNQSTSTVKCLHSYRCDTAYHKDQSWTILVQPTFVLRHGDTSPHLEPGHVASGRSFRVSGRAVWNSLSEDIANLELSLEHFKTALKTHLFRLAYAYQCSQRLCNSVKGCLINVSYIYLYIYMNPPCKSSISIKRIVCL